MNELRRIASYCTRFHSPPRTANGRATIAALELNRVRILNLRRLLMRDGLHPPAHRSANKT